jgi:hypothetical protein
VADEDERRPAIRAPASHGLTHNNKIVELAGYKPDKNDPLKKVTGPISGGWDNWERV